MSDTSNNHDKGPCDASLRRTGHGSETKLKSVWISSKAVTREFIRRTFERKMSRKRKEKGSKYGVLKFSRATISLKKNGKERSLAIFRNGIPEGRVWDANVAQAGWVCGSEDFS